MEEQELFQGYELRNWDFSPRIYKILAFSAIFNVLALLVVAQSNLLTKKGCDSPLVNKVCSVIDTVVVGSNALTTDTAYVNEDYEKTELDNTDIVWVDVTGQEKFNYPDGYFGLSNPELTTPQEITTDPSMPFPDIPGASTSPVTPGYNPIGPNPTTPGSGSLFNQKQKLPKAPKNTTVGKAPDSLIDFGDDKPGETKPPATETPTGPKNNSTRVKKVDDGKTVAAATPTPKPGDPNASPEINKKVMTDFADEVRLGVAKNEIDLTQNFKVIAKGVLTKDGKLDVSEDKATKQPKSGIVQAEGDPRMVEVAKKAIAAIGDSGWLIYLQGQGMDKFNFIVQQDNDNLQVLIVSDLPNDSRAKTVAQGLQGLIDTALMLDKNGFKKLGDDEKLLLANMKPVVNPQQLDQVVLNFVMPKPAAQELITRKLKEAGEKDAPKKPNGSTASFDDRNRNTGK